MSNMIKVDNLWFRYSQDSEWALQGIDLEVKKGEFLCVLGSNGCGKSTLAKHFNSILVPEKGDVWIEDINTKDDDRLLDIRQKVGMVFQNPDNQIVATIVEEDVAFAPENLGVDPAEIRRRVDEALHAVNMYEYRSHAPSQLSGGQKQRVAIAGVIAMQPDCIVLDEPTAMLDPKGRQEVIETIRTLNREKGITVVLITHFMEEAALSDRVIVIDGGRVLLDDAPGKVFAQVEKLKSVGLDVPQVTELSWLLKQEGIDISGEIITETECLNALTALLES